MIELDKGSSSKLSSTMGNISSEESIFDGGLRLRAVRARQPKGFLFFVFFFCSKRIFAIFCIF